MSVQYNGVCDFNKTDDISGRFEESTVVKDSEKDSSTEDEFHGFAKMPIVVVDRIDLTTYLRPKKTAEHVKLEQSSTRKGILKKSVYLDQFTMICAVNIFKHDLGKLKEAISKRSELVSSTNMEKLKCKICAKVCSSEKKLQNHQNNKHMIVYKANSGKPKKRVSFSDNVIVHELKEYHKCRKCPKIFEGYKTLKLHMKKKHKKRKCYICNYCSKKFVDRMFFKVHIKLHCDVCSLLLSNKSEYLAHRRNVCRVLKTYKCKTCGDTFFKIMDMKDHSYSHMDSIFVCDICKDQCKSLCSLAHHISFLHSDKRPTSLYTMRNLGSDRLYLCNFCDESSVERVVIESHTEMLPDLYNRAKTEYKDYYFCDHCYLKFHTELDMVQHKWTHFLKSSDNSQIRQNEDKLKTTCVTSTTTLFKETDEENEPIKKGGEENEPIKKVGEEDEPIKKVGNEDEPIKKVCEEDEPIKKVGEEVEPVKKVGEKNEPRKKFVKTSFRVDEEIPAYMQPEVVLTKLQLKEKLVPESAPSIEENKLDVLNSNLKKPIVDPKSRKTLISKHQCENCGKYFSNNYCLSRHITTQHGDYENLRCNVCEEVFVWPSLLRTHKCIRTYIPEQPFDDARPEIQLENGQANIIHTNGLSELPNDFEDLGINFDDDYNMHNVDFEIPAPIVELHETETVYVPSSTAVTKNNNNSSILNQLLIDGTGQNVNFKITLQEVPIEF